MTRAQAESLYPYNVIVEGMANQGSSPQAILEYIKLMGLDFLGGMNRALELMECYGVNTSELRKLSEARV